MTGWWRRPFGSREELRRVRRALAGADVQIASLRESLAHARRQQQAAELAVVGYAEREQQLRAVAGDASQRPEVALARVMQVLVEGPEPGPVAGGGPE